MSVNINSITDSYNAWYDYKYGGNTRGLSAGDIANIETRWKSNLASWKAQATKDENAYEITDDSLGTAKSQGKSNAKASTGHSGKADTWGTVKGAALGGAAAIGGTVAAGVGGVKMAGAFSKTTTQAASSVKNIGGMSAAKDAIATDPGNTTVLKSNVDKVKDAKGSSLVGAAVIAGTGTLVYAAARIIRSSDPNGDDARALYDLANSILPDAQSELLGAESEMEDASERTIELTEIVDESTDNTNTEMEEAYVEFLMYKEASRILADKANNGVKLTDEEKQFLKEATPIMQELGTFINGAAEENSEFTADAYDEIGGLQKNFDNAAETVAEVQGVTDYAADFDETTVSNTAVMGTVADLGGQGGQAISAGGIMAGVVGAAKMGSIFTFGEGVAMIALGATATVAGAGASDQFGKLKEEQTQYNQIAQAEVEVRAMTQDLDANIQASYEDQVSVYADNIAIVEDEEMEIPDDTQVPTFSVSETPARENENTEAAAGTNAASGENKTESNGNSETNTDANGNQKKKEVK